MKHSLLTRQILPLGLLAALAPPLAAMAQQPAATKTSAKQQAKADNDQDTVVVVVEGVGLTAATAEKQALKNAVRQGVGALIDATTLIKNDELIEDRILTYSHGFVASWDELSRKRIDGLYAIKIKAYIKNRGLSAELVKQKITSPVMSKSSIKLDSNKLFGAAVTKMDARKSAGLILAEAFKQWPLLLGAKIDENPTYDEQNQELRLKIKVGTPADQFARFSKQLIGVAAEIAIDQEKVTTPVVTFSTEAKGSASSSFKQGEARKDGKPIPLAVKFFKDGDKTSPWWDLGNSTSSINLPRYKVERLLQECPNTYLSCDFSRFIKNNKMHPSHTKKTGTWCLWVMTDPITATKANWQRFLLDCNPLFLSPYFDPRNHTIAINLNDTQRTALATHEFPDFAVTVGRATGPYVGVRGVPEGQRIEASFLSCALMGVSMKSKGAWLSSGGDTEGGFMRARPDHRGGHWFLGFNAPSSLREVTAWKASTEDIKEQINVFVAPYPILGYQQLSWGLHIFPHIHAEQTISISPDLLKQVKSINAEVKWNPPVAKEKE